MKQTKFVKIVKFLWIVTFILFVIAITTQIFNIQLYSMLYIASLSIFVITCILSIIAANKDKEHLKNIELAKNDERLKSITTLSKAKAFDILTPIFPMVIVSAFLLKIIDTNSCIVFGILCMLPIVLQLGYFLKFSKKM